MKHWGIVKIIIGALVLLNAFVWPKWLGIDGWIAFFGVLMILCGIVKLFHPATDTVCCPTTKPKKRKR